jgi:23S rRNA (adenine2503-C2)-methyltransferase
VNNYNVLRSTLDQSVNFVAHGEFPGSIEARYVRRCNDYFIIYLSTQTGCRKACRMCHLTQTGQTNAEDLSVGAILEQADRVFDWYDTESAPASVVHLNFMARGEPFSSSVVLHDADELLSRLADRAVSRSLIPRFKFSTIMPLEMAEVELASLFPRHNPDIYYSIYSTKPQFRTRWLPKALEVDNALNKLKDYQSLTRKVPVLHWAFIAGENDDEATVWAICEHVNKAGLRVDFNIVRYNPYSCDQGSEPTVEIIERNARILTQAMPGSRVKVVTRVGFDVKASCGMFVEH